MDNVLPKLLKVIFSRCYGSVTSVMDTSGFPCARRKGTSGSDEVLINVLLGLSNDFVRTLKYFSRSRD